MANVGFIWSRLLTPVLIGFIYAQLINNWINTSVEAILTFKISVMELEQRCKLNKPVATWIGSRNDFTWKIKLIKNTPKP